MAALEVRYANATRACAGRERARRAAHAPLGVLRELAGALTAARRAAVAALEVRSASAARACAGRERAMRAAHAPLGERRRALVTVASTRSGVQPWLAAAPHGAKAVAAAQQSHLSVAPA